MPDRRRRASHGRRQSIRTSSTGIRPGVVDANLVKPDSIAVGVGSARRLSQPPRYDDTFQRDPSVHCCCAIHNEKLGASKSRATPAIKVDATVAHSLIWCHRVKGL